MKLELTTSDLIYLGFITFYFVLGCFGLYLFFGVAIGSLYGFITYRLITK